MSVLDQIRELEAQKQKLLKEAKQSAIKKAQAAIAELKELGFSYSLTEGEATRATGGTRRTGIRNDVLDIIKKTPNGINRADILATMDAKGDKSAEQSVSNALSALKKQNAVTGKDGTYKVVA